MAKIKAGAAAKIIGCSYWTIRKWAELGLISGEPVGNGHYLYDEEELETMKGLFRRHNKPRKMGRARTAEGAIEVSHDGVGVIIDDGQGALSLTKSQATRLIMDLTGAFMELTSVSDEMGVTK